MKLIQETDMFQFMNGNREAVINTRIKTLITGGMKNVSQELDYNLRTIERAFKDPLTIAALDAIHLGNLIPFIAVDPKESMPIYMPFIKFATGDGKMRMAVDLTQFSEIRYDEINDMLDVKINNAKLYVLLVTAYIYYEFANKTTALTPAMNQLTSSVWAKMIVNIFNAELGLSTNRERQDAFMYFAQKFFLKNILECAPAICENDAIYQFPNKKKPNLVVEMESIIAEKGIDIYADFTTFISTLLNADITGLNQNRAKIKSGQIGLQWFMSKFIARYGVASGFAVAAFPYFMWMLFSANNSAWMFTGDRIIENLSKTEFPKIMNEIYRMIRN